MGFWDKAKQSFAQQVEDAKQQRAQGEHAQRHQTTATYEGEKAMRKGIAQMQRKGWMVVNTTTYQPRAGVGRMVALGIFAAVFKPKVKFVVTFARE